MPSIMMESLEMLASSDTLHNVERASKRANFLDKSENGKPSLGPKVIRKSTTVPTSQNLEYFGAGGFLL